jgi:hypothetical protein
MVDVFMALLSFRGFDTPSLPAQGEQRRSTYFNIGRDIPSAFGEDATTPTMKEFESWFRENALFNLNG